MAKSSKHNYAAEDRELDEAFQNITGRSTPLSDQKTCRKGGTIVAIISVIAALSICIAAGIYFYFYRDMDSVISGNISVAGVNIQGMTQAEAIKAVQHATKNTYGTQAMSVTVLEHSIEIPADCIKGLNAQKAIKAAYKYGSVSDPLQLNLEPYLRYDEEQIRNCLAQLVALNDTALSNTTYQISGNEPDLTLEITIGTPEYGLDLNSLFITVMEAYSKNSFTAEGQYTIIEPAPIDLQAIWEVHHKAAVDAYYDKTQKKIVESVYGYGFDIEVAAETIKNASHGTTVKIPFKAIAPTVTEDDVEATLFQDTLATFTATSSSKTNRDTNLRLACESINGIVLHPGDSFSYNNALGERTADKGYLPAPSYAGNQTVNTLGGGICQVSSCLYYCVVSAELTVIERKNHGFLPSYMPSGTDATVNWGTIDFRFKNDLEFPVRIEAKSIGGKTTISLLGTETRTYRTELKGSVISTTAYSTEYQVFAADNKEGYKDGETIVTPYTGKFVESYLYKYDRTTGQLISKEFIAESNYRKRNAVVCKIESTTNTPTTPEESVPDDSGSQVTPDTNIPEETP